MQAEELEKYRVRLLHLRSRIAGDAGHVVDAIRSSSSPSDEGSHLPTHAADNVPPEPLEADIEVLGAETGLIEQIDAAIDRIDDRSFGTCASCGRAIAGDRLEALPYTALCVACAQAQA
jgi:DnaK suppressor protein